MIFVLQVLKEQVNHFGLILRLSSYDIKSKYQMHYLGMLWQFINPIIQVLIYWFVFGLGIRGGTPVGEVPYYLWLIVGLIPWFFLSPSIVQGSNSVYAKVNLVSKMKFPVSVLPTITIVSNAFNFFIMLIVLGLLLIFLDITSGIYLIQLPYYIFCLFIFLFSVTLFSSTISIIVRDFQLVIQSLMRMLFFLTPILWDASEFSEHIQAILKLNPLFYIVDGFRSTFLNSNWFYEDYVYTLYFWSITLLLLFVGSIIHVKFRKKFVDYL